MEELFDRYPGKIACLILEPEKDVAPKNNFLNELKELCEKNGTVFILDEQGKYKLIGIFAGDSQVKVNVFDDFKVDLLEVFKE